MGRRGLVERALRTPQRWPVRWRLAAVSATLTLIILLGFAAVVGRLTENKLEGDFRDDLRDTAGQLAFETEVTHVGARLAIRRPDLTGSKMADGAIFRVITESGQVVGPANTPDLGPPEPDSIQTVGAYEVATAPIPTSELGLPPLFVQYARDHQDLQTTIDRLWLFLGAGVLVGAGLAYLAGLAVASRAMRPISSLTAAAREIASTRDPSRRIPSPDTDDEVAELASTLDDMLRALDQSRSETQQAMQRQREFVADASHELRTPLTSILANLELLQTSLEAADREDRAAVTSALRSSKRMRRLVADLLLLARADAGRVSARQACDLAEIAAGALAEVRPVAGEHELALSSDGPVTVEGNPDELHRMVLNLLDNAVQHTPDGTEIAVNIGRENGRAVLEVSDDGPGIPAGMERQVFDRFVRGVGPADRATGDGTGLGLAIVEAVASSHGGEAEAGPSPAGGARFTVRLPAGHD
ncbi:MAG TPA: HAMP domain-containing sensor histidine kinase [Solirubrobacterales bacterium]|nr:HAMP domain-containing sensor histidine kinase [Solirubrobacterales bacterium]